MCPKKSKHKKPGPTQSQSQKIMRCCHHGEMKHMAKVQEVKLVSAVLNLCNPCSSRTDCTQAKVGKAMEREGSTTIT